MLEELLLTVGFQCVHFSHEAPDAQHMIDAKMKLFNFDAANKLSEQTFLSQIAVAMQFPEYFGNNWDALDECLRDLSWVPASGYVLVVHNARHLWKHSPEIAGKFVESWLFAAEQWATERIPFHLIFLL